MNSNTTNNTLALMRLKKNQHHHAYDNILLPFDKVYEALIKPLESSPLLFNHFHWVINYKDRYVIHSSGVKKILGYDDINLTFEKYQNIVHPNFLSLINDLSTKVFDLFRNEKYRRFSREAHFCLQFPIQHNNGSYLLVQQSCTILSIDKEYNPVIVYSRFENLGQYTKFPMVLKPRVYINNSAYSLEMEKYIEDLLAKESNSILLKHVKLTDQQVKILRCLSNDKSLDAIGQELRIAIETIKVHNKNILSKAKEKISPMFSSAREVSIFLKEALVI